MALSTDDLPRELEAAGRIQSADHVLDVAAGRERNVAAQRQSHGDGEAFMLLRDQLSRSDPPGSAG
jgi:hypothetical protein